MDENVQTEKSKRWRPGLGARIAVRLIALTVALVLIAMILPNVLEPRVTYSKNSCQANLTQINGAKKQWALDNEKREGDMPAWEDLVGEGKYLRARPTCPVGGSYTIGPVGGYATCGATTNGFPDHRIPFP